jgi:hypothetical protein
MSFITSSVDGREPSFKRTKMSPVLASVSPSPNWRPVRREAVAVGLLKNLHQHGILTIGRDANPLRHMTERHLRDIAQTHYAMTICANNDASQRLDRAGLIVGEQQIELVVIGDMPHRLDRRSMTHRCRHIGEIDVLRAQSFQIDIGMKFVNFSTLHAYMRNTGNTAQQSCTQTPPAICLHKASGACLAITL